MTAMASPALAQDGGTGGFKAGVVMGADSVRVSDGTEKAKKSSLLYGVTAGYDADLGGGILGVEVEYTGTGGKKKVNSTTPPLVAIPQTTEPAELTQFKAKSDFYIGARAGINVGSSSLVYFKAGYTSAKVGLEAFDETNGLTSISSRQKGFRMGPGVEVGLSKGFAIRAEYRYSNYGKYEYMKVDTGLKTKRHQGVIALVGRF
ncbi:outer membrane protein [Altererythrobacter sp.]|uniref:outer membrane protein n=1 Tax=Altererythrobacter sp. TaxID=1872480 RepID=UPI003D05D67F